MEWRMFFMRISLWYHRVPFGIKFVIATVIILFAMFLGGYYLGYAQGNSNALQLLDW